MSNLQSLSYHVDLVMVIDLTGSMGHIIRSVRTAAINFQEQLVARMSQKGKVIAQLRVRVVGFRDMFADQECFVESQFFNLPQEQKNFSLFVSSLKAKGGGGDGPESGLEGLSLAINSDWTKEGDRRRHIVVMWSDARPHPLEKGQGNAPAGLNDRICQTFDALTDEWEVGQRSGIDRNSRRLVLYAPDVAEWHTISDAWSQVVHFPSIAGKGLREFEMDLILDGLANSI